MRYELKAELGGIAIRIPYPNAGSYTVWANGREMPYTPWDEAAGRHAALTEAAGCGENRFVGIENFLDFYLTPGCSIEIKPRDAIMTSVRLEWTLEEFYADQGVTRFSDRVAAALGIHRSTVHVVAVYEGSVIIDFFIGAEPDDEEPAATLLAIKNDLLGKIAANAIDLGAPILGAVADGELVVGECYENCEEQKDVDGNLWDDLVKEGDGKDGTTKGDGTKGPTEKEAEISISVKVSKETADVEIKYPILILAIIAVVLLLIVGFIILRMCCAKSAVLKQDKVLRKLDTMQEDEQYVMKMDDEKNNIFPAKRHKKNPKVQD